MKLDDVLELATQGPWHAGPQDKWLHPRIESPHGQIAHVEPHHVGHETAAINAALLAHSRNVMPDLLDVLRKAMRISALWAPPDCKVCEHYRDKQCRADNPDECHALEEMRLEFIDAIAKAEEVIT